MRERTGTVEVPMVGSYYWDPEAQAYRPAASGYVETWTSSDSALCPDLLRLSDLGAADSWRGHLVRGIFRVLGWITGI